MPVGQGHPSLREIASGGEVLPNVVTVVHGPKRNLGYFFLIAHAEAKRMGVTIRVHDELHSLVRANQHLQSSWGPLVPTFDPGASHLTSDTAFWLSCHDAGGDLVACSAARHLQLTETGLADEFRSLRLFYANPQPHLDRGTICVVEEEAAAVAGRMRGHITYSGAIWTRPDFRGRGIVYLLSRVNRNLALTRWDADYTASVTRVDLAAKGALSPYGYRSARRIALQNSYRGDFDMSLIWVDRAAMEADLDHYVAEYAPNAARVTEAEETMSPTRAVQGSIRRS